jgi:hypothetical protein
LNECVELVIISSINWSIIGATCGILEHVGIIEPVFSFNILVTLEHDINHEAGVKCCDGPVHDNSNVGLCGRKPVFYHKHYNTKYTSETDDGNISIFCYNFFCAFGIDTR